MSQTAAHIRKVADIFASEHPLLDLVPADFVLAAEGLRRWAAEIGRAEYEAAHKDDYMPRFVRRQM